MALDAFVIDNAMLWIGDGRELDGHLEICGDRIAAVRQGRYGGPLPVTELKGGTALSPGMIDLMVLGGFGSSILRDDPVEIARRFLPLGVTTVQFSGGMLPCPGLERLAGNTRRAVEVTAGDSGVARVLGIYLEGPFEMPQCAGAALRHNALPPTPEHVGRVLDLFGPALRMINVSPGIEGDAQAVRLLASAGKVVTMAHSNAEAHRVLACLDAGTQALGHVWNNNSGLLGDSGVQQPTLEHVALTDERVRFIHLICDGTYVHPILIRLILRSRGLGAICLVTDANHQAGCPDGVFTRDDGQVFHKAKGVCRTAKGHLAGSATMLPEAFRHFVAFTGLPPREAIRTVTRNPAIAIDAQDWLGLLTPGYYADLVAWDEQLKVRRVWRSGREVARAESTT